MFRPTKAFKDYVTGHKNEPSLRIGKRVPKDAVNLAYYFNPTSDEKILAADPPRNTIDHREAGKWFTRLDIASGPNGEEPPIDTFPLSTYYEDEEGYAGWLYRQDETVQWYGEKHENQHSKTFENDQIIVKKGDEDKKITYEDADGFRGNLYLDTVEYEVDAWKDVSVTEEVDYTIKNFELNYHTIFGSYLNRDEMNQGGFLNVPNAIHGQDYCWPAQIQLTATKLRASDGTMPATDTNNRIANYINNLDNNFEGTNDSLPNSTDIVYTSKPIGYLYFDHLEYEPGVSYDQNPRNGSRIEGELPEITTDQFAWETDAWGQDTWEDYGYQNIYPDISKATIDGQGIFSVYLADMSVEYGYENIEFILNILKNKTDFEQTQDYYKLQEAINNGHDIAIYLEQCVFHVGDEEINMLVTRDGKTEADEDDDIEDTINTSIDISNCYFTLRYKYVIADKGVIGDSMFNIYAVYHTITNEKGCSVKRKITTKKQEASRYKAHCVYSGLVDKNWIDYDGKAYYKGSLVKGNAIGNQNADGDNEILMYPDKDGYLRKIVESVESVPNEQGIEVEEVVLKDYYTIEADTVYITNIFKEGVPCFYKYRLKTPIYDYRGPDEKGFYQGDAVQIYMSNMKEIPENYKHNMRLVTADTETVTTYDAFNNPVKTKKPKCYLAELYTSFVSNSTDTFKVIYNGFDDIDNNNKVMENGIEEDIYNYPFMIDGLDYKLKLVNKKARLNTIQILNYTPIEDTRRRVTFNWYITATDENTGEVFKSETRQSSILNKDYVLPCEYSNFIDRAMIISPKLSGNIIPCTPYELCREDQAAAQHAWTEEHNKMLSQALDNEDDDEYALLSMEDFKVLITPDRKLIFKAHIQDIDADGSVNISCNPDGTGYITAETTIDTGFYNEVRASYTKQLDLQNPYWTDGQYIYEGYKVKCIDSRNIKVKAPRETGLLESWYPMVQFGHYSRILDQYGAHTKVCYSMPEYDTQHYSDLFGQPYVDVKHEKVDILNPHIVKTKAFPLYVLEPAIDENTYIYKGKFYRVITDEYLDWTEAELACKKIGGHLVIPKNQDENDFILKIAKKYDFHNIWIGIKDNESVDGTIDIFENTEDQEYEEDEIYTKMYISDNDETTDENDDENKDLIGKWYKTTETNIDGISGYICEITGVIKLYKQVEDEIFDLTIKNISFSDGVIIIEEAVSESDNIFADYTYLEENYVYRGYWRNENDFVRIDLNPNMYHTYNNPDYYPSATSPTKNLFNKMIYFFMKPSIEYEIPEIEDGRLFYDSIDGKMYKIIDVPKTIKIGEEEVITGYTEPEFVERRFVERRATGELNEWDEVIPPDFSGLSSEELQEMADNPVRTIYRGESNNYDFEKTWNGSTIKTTYSSQGFKSLVSINGQPSSRITSRDFDYNGLNIKINDTQQFEGLVQIQYSITNNSNETIHNINIGAGSDIQIGSDDSATIEPIKKDGTVIGIKMISEKDTDSNGNHPGFAFIGPGFNIGYGRYGLCINDTYILSIPNPSINGMMYDGTLTGTDSGLCFRQVISELEPGKTKNIQVYFGIYSSNIDYNVQIIHHADPIYEDVYEDIYTESEPIYETRDITKDITVEEKEEVNNIKIIKENDQCLYHKINDSEPDEDIDILVGSVFIRANTSLHSTVLTDSRTRGGGILKEISDSLRKELEPESDFYLDIGYYDGEPYQENGVIIVRLDNKLLKDFGGRFTIGDIEQKVKRWLGVGIYPIIEFVDSYRKQDLPQYTIEIEDSYTNVIDIIPEFYVSNPNYNPPVEEIHDPVPEDDDEPEEPGGNSQQQDTGSVIIDQQEQEEIIENIENNEVSTEEDGIEINFSAVEDSDE